MPSSGPCVEHLSLGGGTALDAVEPSEQSLVTKAAFEGDYWCRFLPDSDSGSAVIFSTGCRSSDTTHPQTLSFFHHDDFEQVSSCVSVSPSLKWGERVVVAHTSNLLKEAEA